MSKDASFRMPRPDSRTAVVGSTGTGKTQFGIWLLSQMDFHIRPWIIFDFKGDQLIADIRPEEISVRSDPPKKPGLYVVRPISPTEDDLVTEFLWKIWRNEDTGIYIDEGYMIAGGNRGNPAFRSCLTQGRSKLIQMIILSQRPVWMDRFVFSEADFFATFRLNDKRDYLTVQQMISVDVKERLPAYWSRWYDVGADKGFTMKPVPDRQTLIDTFERRWKPKPRVI